MQEKKRLKEFDLLKTVAIFLVIWGHCIQDLYSSPPTENGVFTTIYSIHMPLFMTISGYFAWSSMQKGITTLLVKKVRQLLIPCISGSVMMWLSILLLAAFHNKSVSFYQLIHEIIYGYWFLKSCFLCYMLAWIGHQGGGGKIIKITGTLIISILAPYYFHLWIMYPCFLLGIYLHNQPQKLQWLSNHFWLPVAVFLLMLIPWGKPFWDYHEVIQPILAGLVKGQPVDIRPIIFDLYRLVIGMVGSLAFITFFQKYSHIANCFQLTDTLCRWGQYTLQTYILQGVVLETFMARLLKFDGISQDVFSLIVCPVLSVIVLITCVSLTKFISRHSLANLLLFGHT